MSVAARVAFEMNVKLGHEVTLHLNIKIICLLGWIFY